MKKAFYLISLILSVLTVNSCVQPLEEGQKHGNANTLSLSVRCMDPLTKAVATEPYDETYNENKLTHIDWFIFPTNDASAKAVLHQRVSWTGDKAKPDVRSEFLAASRQMEDYKEKIGTTGYVYVIANLPSTFTHVEDATVDVSDKVIQYSGGIQYTESGTTKTALTLQELQTLPLSTNFNLYELENADYTSAVFKAQDDFVMASDEVMLFTLSEDTPAEVHAKLSRVAAKITLEITVKSAVDEVESQMVGRWKQGETYVKTWYPDVENIDVYLSYANGASNLTVAAGQEAEYNDETFFTYNRYAFTPVITSSSPTDFPDKWIVKGTPFYSYPMKWKVSNAHAPFIKIIIPWRPYTEQPVYETVSWPNPDNDTQSVSGYKVTGASRENWDQKTVNPQEFFYKISIPDETTLRSNTWYKLALDVAILGGTSDDLSTTLSGQYYVINWSAPDVAANGDLEQGKYLNTLSTDGDIYYIYGGDEIEIPVLSSHNIVVSSTTTRTTTASWTDFYNDGNNDPREYSGTAGLNALTRQPTITADGRKSITFKHELMTDISVATANNKPDVSKYTFEVTIANAAGLTKTITIIQLPPLMINRERNYAGITYTNATHGYVYINKGTSAYGGIRSSFSGGGSSSNNPNMYTITTTVIPDVSPDLEEVIADPRKTESSLLSMNTESAPAIGQTTNRRLSYYYPTDEYMNKIAPKFRIASSWGVVPSPYVDFDDAQRRCATYQEDGIPAGRWRVPTRAEIEYMIKLSTIRVIPKLFTEENPTTGYGYGQRSNFGAGGYWSSDGGVVYPWNAVNPLTGHTVDYLSAGELASNNAATNNGVRCVYDEWFWGLDDRVDRSTFTWGDRQIQFQ